jgi:hypothetical protein
MSNELSITYPTGNTLYAILENAVGQVYNGAAFEAPINANWLTYDVAMTEAGTTGIYLGDMPVITAGVYYFTVRLQAGGAPAVGDIGLGTGQIQWNGTIELPLSSVATSVAAASASASAGEILILRGDSMNQAITGLGNITTRTEMWFTVKRKVDDTDAEAILLISARLRRR